MSNASPPGGDDPGFFKKLVDTTKAKFNESHKKLITTISTSYKTNIPEFKIPTFPSLPFTAPTTLRQVQTLVTTRVRWGQLFTSLRGDFRGFVAALAFTAIFTQMNNLRQSVRQFEQKKKAEEEEAKKFLKSLPANITNEVKKEAFEVVTTMSKQHEEEKKALQERIKEQKEKKNALKKKVEEKEKEVTKAKKDKEDLKNSFTKLAGPIYKGPWEQQ
jgi:hypothetical protein